MSSAPSFSLYDCGLVRQATGRLCSNLRDLHEALRNVSDAVIEHHMMRCALEDYFELYEFPNDLARWCWDGLGDQVLGEELGLVDPYRADSIAAVRTTLFNVVEDRLWSLEHIPWCRPGLELPLIESRLIAYDTGERFATPIALAEALEQLPPRSLFFHFHEARRRTGGESDDFSLWLDGWGGFGEVVASLRALDFYSLNLNQLRQEILAIFQGHFADAADGGIAAP